MVPMSRTPRSPLDAALIAQGRKARWLADRLGVHESEVSRWRAGIHMPEQATRQRIMELLGRTDLWPPDEHEKAA